MLVRVVRVANLPGGLLMAMDDAPEGLILWVQQDVLSAEAASLLEQLMDTLRVHWDRHPVTRRSATLRAV